MKQYRPHFKPVPNTEKSKADTIRDTLDLIGNDASQDMINLLKKKAREADSAAGETERDTTSYLLVMS